MKNFKRILLVVILCLCVSANSNAEGLKAFKLPNGLSVFVWEDETIPNVFGSVVVNVGSKEEPAEYTGLAHYLEHMLFKGTDKIGAIDWAKEKPIYEQIIAKYDERAATADPILKEALSKEINELTIEAAKYSQSNEFSGIVQGMAGEVLNAGTSYDYTLYFNLFPPGEIYKWLQLYSERLINPVFRSFQPELENVYEEYNRAQDNPNHLEQNFVMSTLFAGHPYSRSVIGLPEHLKNPQLSQLVDFYNTWYVPNNMALVLVGDIKTNDIIPLVKETFGRLESRVIPERKVYPETPLKGRKEVSAKLSQYPNTILAFPGITAASKDKIALDICTSILSNSANTGLIDKLVLDGDLSGANASVDALKERGWLTITAIPYYDMNQRRFESLKSTENALLKEIKKLQEGKFEDWLVQSIKSDLIRSFDLKLESTQYGMSKLNEIADAFITGKDLQEFLQYKERVEAITTEEIKAIAKKYFGKDYYAIYLNEGKPSKSKDLEKPDIEPIKPLRDAESEYAKAFRHLPVKNGKPSYADLNEVVIRPINDLSKLYYTQNPENEVFSLILKFGIGEEKMPKLGFAAPLMNNAGIMGSMDAQAVKQEFSNLGATCRYRIDDNYLSVILTGFETNLEAACNLMTRQILLPQLDEKQLNSLIGRYYQQLKIEKTSSASLSNALREYVLYKEKSDYIDRLTLDEVKDLTVSNLTGEFQRATDYAAQIHYIGTLPIDDVQAILSTNLPLKEGEKPSTSPEIRERVDYKENTVFFLPDHDAKQSTIYFYVDGDNYTKEKDPYTNAFNEYFNGGFTGLVLSEIREYRSLAYSAGGSYRLPALENNKAYFLGEVGTQADKTLDAVGVFMDLLTNMPQHPEHFTDIKNFLKGEASIEKPHYRNASQIYESWKLRGYTQSPAETNQSAIDNLTFDQIVKFYNDNIKGRPVAIAIVGNPKMIDEKALAKYGKVTKLSSSKVFSAK
ncbi:MAG: insulinase family protein [Candidatus Symbiothrix sp.]|jgi:predicted Zn-dependent peptidase|nr:insulinase family protein [Candidatus Symbiothrix sp.]